MDYTADIFDALDVQDELQTLYTSGTVFHAFLGEKLPDWKAAANLVRKIAANYKLPYYTLSPTYSICREHGYLAGEVKTCPHCGAATEVYSRITGYYRPVQNWNDGKLQEYANRKEYVIEKSILKRQDAVELAEAQARKETVQKEAVQKEAEKKETAKKEEAKVDALKAGSVRKTPGKKRKYLFTTKTCPNCQLAKEYLEDVDYEVIDAEEDADRVNRYGVMQAPTLVIVDDDKVYKYVNASNIKRYVDQVGGAG